MGIFSSHEGAQHGQAQHDALQTVVCHCMQVADLCVELQVGRAGAAVALAPFVDACLLMIQCRLGLRNRQAAFYLMVSLCCAVTAIVFGGVIALWS